MEGLSRQSWEIYYAFVLSGLLEECVATGLDIANGREWNVDRSRLSLDANLSHHWR